MRLFFVAVALTLPAISYADAAAQGVATIVQTVEYSPPNENPEYQFGEGLSTIFPFEDTFGEIGPFGFDVSCLDDPLQYGCPDARFDPFDECLGTLTAVSFDFTVFDSVTHGDFYLEGILNINLPHNAGAVVTHDGFRWLIESNTDADAFDVAGSPSFSFSVTCMGVPGDGDDCAGGMFGEVLNSGFGFSLSQRSVGDLGLFRAAFFSVGISDADFNGDAVTNPADLGVMRSFFFGPPGPSGLVGP